MNRSSRIAAVLAACHSRRPDAHWTRSVNALAAERAKVEAMLARGATVYGFTTMLGHLDHHGRSPDVVREQALLAAHLVGATEPLAPATARLVTACKLEQLAAGGSGIHSQTYASIVDAFSSQNEGMRGCWQSYGSGDVVPAAWWLQSLVDAGGVSIGRSGDVIALINGHFFSTAIAIESALRFADLVGATLAVLTSHARREPLAAGWDDRALAAWESFAPKPNDNRPTQLPVSLRDTEPTARVLLNAVVHLTDAIEARLAGPSANPLFVNSNAGIEARSQSSFLDFGLTIALTEARQAALIALGILQRVAHHLTSELQAAAPEPRQELVQPPKIAAAYLTSALMSATLPGDFVGDESDGIEDLRDLSLFSARALDNLVTEFAGPTLELVASIFPRPIDLETARSRTVALLTLTD